MRVLIVDDSVTFRSQIRRALEALPGVTVAGTAANGKIALQMLEKKEVDLITLDINMPEMDGIAFLDYLHKNDSYKVKVIVFAHHTARSARDTVKALSLGAVDFVIKPTADNNVGMVDAYEAVLRELAPKVLQFVSAEAATNQTAGPKASTTSKADVKEYTKVDIDHFDPSVIVVASSTGGPKALENFFSQLKRPPSMPVLVVQHMPEMFTKFLSKRLGDMMQVECREGIDGELVEPGIVYVAPGNFHMTVKMEGKRFAIQVDQTPRVNFVRPAADLLFRSAAQLFGKGCMGFVLTGMGEDGKVGSQAIKASGGGIMIQDKESSIVWGMPGSVHGANAFDKIGSIQECAKVLARMCTGVPSP